MKTIGPRPSACETEARPPTFVLWANSTYADFPPNYLRQMRNAMRDEFRISWGAWSIVGGGASQGRSCGIDSPAGLQPQGSLPTDANTRILCTASCCEIAAKFLLQALFSLSNQDDSKGRPRAL